MAGFRFFVAKKQFEIAISIGINPKPLLTMEGCTEFTNVTCNVTTTVFVKDGVIMGKRFVKVDGINKSDQWININGHHRDGDLPACIEYADNKVIKESWCINGKSHREGDLPAVIYYKNGKVIKKSWCRNNVHYRDNDLPAQVSYDENGKVNEERWLSNNKVHRDNGPAIIHYRDGKVISQHWAKNGLQYRDGNQPAEIHYDDDKIVSQSYYKDGVEHPAPKPEEPTANILARINKDLATLQARLAENAK